MILKVVDEGKGFRELNTKKMINLLMKQGFVRAIIKEK